jgi:SAM-dependent methyltransferase
MEIEELCPLCAAPAGRFFEDETRRSYFRCGVCALRFLDPAARPDAQAERAQYVLHENDPADPGYRRFLSKLADPLMSRLQPGSAGLDYGCGPGPALAAMLTEAGHQVALYDPFFAPDPTPLSDTYDFVVCTETAEHFHDPAAEFARLASLVRPGGVMALMTCFQTDDARFPRWHYRLDPTHVAFYRAETFAFIAACLGWKLDVPAKDVAILERPAKACRKRA